MTYREVTLEERNKMMEQGVFDINGNIPAHPGYTGIHRHGDSTYKKETEMKIISFAWTTPAIEVKLKTCTRRDWDDIYASRFNKGDLLAGYDRNPRFKGSQITTIRLTEKPYKERYCDAPLGDWFAEGFDYLQSIGAKVHGVDPSELWENWITDVTQCYVVRFEYA